MKLFDEIDIETGVVVRRYYSNRSTDDGPRPARIFLPDAKFQGMNVGDELPFTPTVPRENPTKIRRTQ